MTEWKKYEGTDEQIVEMKNARRGILIRLNDDKPGTNEFILSASEDFNRGISEYLICNPHPLKEMIIKQAQTGQPVYWKDKETGQTGKAYCDATNWDADFFEYSFTPFED